MAANQLVETFESAVQLFNSQDWPRLALLLHRDVTMKKIDDAVEYHKGKAALMGYFYTHGDDDKATFKPTSADHKIVDNLGLVWGSADWVTTQGAKAVPIAYAYAFKKVGGNWLALNLWGAYSA